MRKVEINKRAPIRKLTMLISPICILLISIGYAFGHGGEKHDSTETIETNEKTPTDSLPTSQVVALDSIYAIIQSEFIALEPTFKKGCFDCHTTRTDFPWYYKLPLVKGMIEDDISEAKKHMDMSNGFPFGGHGKPVDDLVAVREVVEKGDMPPLGYRFMHWSAEPSDDERDSIIAWIERSLESLALVDVHPTDSIQGADGADPKSVYVCLMHPEITSDHQEDCSLCGSPLEPAAAESNSKGDTITKTNSGKPANREYVIGLYESGMMYSNRWMMDSDDSNEQYNSHYLRLDSISLLTPPQQGQYRDDHVLFYLGAGLSPLFAATDRAINSDHKSASSVYSSALLANCNYSNGKMLPGL